MRKPTANRVGAFTRLLVTAITLTAISGIGLVSAAPTAGAAPFCGITWGSLDKTGDQLSGPPGNPDAPDVFNARTGQHDCYDRFVVDLGQPNGTAYFVRYVPVVLGDASGLPVPLRGGAFIQISLRTFAHDLDTGLPTYAPPNPLEACNVAGFRTFRQVAFVDDFEGTVTFGLGVRARLPFRVFNLQGPGGGSRVVIDVAHRWS
jgi:hypothetical protein